MRLADGRRRLLLALHWALPPLAAVATGWLFGRHPWVIGAVVAACIVFRPIHLGPLARVGLVFFVLSPLGAGFVVSIDAVQTLWSAAWDHIETIPILLFRLPVYLVFSVLTLILMLIASVLSGVLVMAPAIRLIDLESGARQAFRDRAAAEILAYLVNPGRGPPPRFSLYLRPFKTTGELATQLVDGGAAESPGRPIQTDYEAILASAFPAHRPLIALGTPGALLSTRPEGHSLGPIDPGSWGIPGTGKVASTEADWHETVMLLAQHAETIVIVPLNFAGTQWEIETLQTKGMLPKCVFVVPATMPGARDYEAGWKETREYLGSIGILTPTYESSGGLFRIDRGSLRQFQSFISAPLPRAIALMIQLALLRRQGRSM